MRRVVLIGVASVIALVASIAVAGPVPKGGTFAGIGGTVGGALTVSTGLSLTGGTMTGQIVSSGVTTDVTTGTNENYTVAPNGTGDFVVTTDAASWTFGSAFLASTATSGNNAFQLQPAANTGGAYATFNTAAAALGGQVGYYDSSFSDADYAGKVILRGGTGKKISIIRDDDVAAGTDMLELRDNASSTGSIVFAVDGNGGVRFRNLTSAHGATCNSSNEGILYYISISASSKSGFCVCAETSPSTFAWKMAITVGDVALTDGDC